MKKLLDQQLDLRQQPSVVDRDAARQKPTQQQRHLTQIAILRREIGQAALGFAHQLGGMRHRPQRDAARSRLLGRPSAEQEVDGRGQRLTLEIAHDPPRCGLLARILVCAR